MLKKMMAVSVLGLLFLAGCAKEGPMGPAGPEGPQGPQGPSGTTVLAQFTVKFSTANNNMPSNTHPISVPEILNKQSTTWVEMYWTSQSFTDPQQASWTPLADGPSATSHWAVVSWSNGTITAMDMVDGDSVYIKVMQHN